VLYGVLVRQKKLTFKFDDVNADKRLRELILHVSAKCADDPTFGAVKLNKVLFFSDFYSYAQTGKAITGAEYQKLPQGPAPKRLLPIRRDLEKKGALAIQQIPMGNNVQKRPIALVPADLSDFTGAEIAKVDKVIEILRGHSAATVSEVSHKRAWRIAGDNESIPYEAALLSDDGITDFQIGRAKELAVKYEWES